VPEVVPVNEPLLLVLPVNEPLLLPLLPVKPDPLLLPVKPEPLLLELPLEPEKPWAFTGRPQKLSAAVNSRLVAIQHCLRIMAIPQQLPKKGTGAFLRDPFFVMGSLPLPCFIGSKTCSRQGRSHFSPIIVTDFAQCNSRSPVSRRQALRSSNESNRLAWLVDEGRTVRFLPFNNSRQSLSRPLP